MNLVYGIKDKPKLGQVVLFALQQLLAIMAATIAVPAVVNSVTGSAMTASAALFGAGVGSVVYLLFTKSSSPVFLGSSFAFLGPMFTAFGGAASMAVGYAGLRPDYRRCYGRSRVRDSCHCRQGLRRQVD